MKWISKFSSFNIESLHCIHMRALNWFYLPIEGDRLRALKTQLPLMHLTLIPTSKKRFSLCRQPFNHEAYLKAMGMPERVDSIVCLSLFVTRNETGIDRYSKNSITALVIINSSQNIPVIFYRRS